MALTRRLAVAGCDGPSSPVGEPLLGELHHPPENIGKAPAQEYRTRRGNCAAVDFFLAPGDWPRGLLRDLRRSEAAEGPGGGQDPTVQGMKMAAKGEKEGKKKLRAGALR